MIKFFPPIGVLFCLVFLVACIVQVFAIEEDEETVERGDFVLTQEVASNEQVTLTIHGPSSTRAIDSALARPLFSPDRRPRDSRSDDVQKPVLEPVKVLQPEPVVVKKPDIVFRGVMRSGEEFEALLLDGSTQKETWAEVRDYIDGWVVQTITDRKITLSHNETKEIVVFERAR